MAGVGAGACNSNTSEVETGVWIPGSHWPSVSWRENYWDERVGEMAQWVKTLASESRDLSLLPRTGLVEGET